MKTIIVSFMLLLAICLSASTAMATPIVCSAPTPNPIVDSTGNYVCAGDGGFNNFPTPDGSCQTDLVIVGGYCSYAPVIGSISCSSYMLIMWDYWYALSGDAEFATLMAGCSP